MITEEQWIKLADFHFSEANGLPEKAQLYLTGISSLGQQFMEETNATSFKVAAELPHKASGKIYRATYSLEELK